jgi:hypothetical protein
LRTANSAAHSGDATRRWISRPTNCVNDGGGQGGDVR